MYVMANDDRISVDRGKAIDAALLSIEKRFGKGSIMRLGERDVSDIPAISTTSLSLDAAVGVGGVPRGRICEIYGPESSGKTGRIGGHPAVDLPPRHESSHLRDQELRQDLRRVRCPALGCVSLDH